MIKNVPAVATTATLIQVVQWSVIGAALFSSTLYWVVPRAVRRYFSPATYNATSGDVWVRLVAAGDVTVAFMLYKMASGQLVTGEAQRLVLGACGLYAFHQRVRECVKKVPLLPPERTETPRPYPASGTYRRGAKPDRPFDLAQSAIRRRDCVRVEPNHG